MSKPRGWFVPTSKRFVVAVATVGLIATAGSVQAPAMGASERVAVSQSRLSLTTNWPGAPLARSTTRAVTGTFEGPTREVHLQRQVPGSWVSVDQASSQLNGTYALTVPTDSLGTFRFRVVGAPLPGTAAVVSDAFDVAVRPSWRPAGNSADHTLLAPWSMARWNPCQVIGYRVNERQARPGAVEAVKSAIAQVSLATGLRFAYRGTSQRIPQNVGTYEYGPETELLIAWARPSQTDILGSGTNILGVGGPIYFGSGYEDGAGRPMGLVVKGQVVMNTQYNNTLKAGTDRSSLRVETLMHEIGHVVGLGHARRSSQIMYGDGGSPKRVLWGAGDLEGLRRVGFSGGCVTPQTQRRQVARTQARDGVGFTAPGTLLTHFER